MLAAVALCALVAAFAFFRRPGFDAPGDAPLPTVADSSSPSAQVVGVYRIGRRSLSKTITLTAELRPYNVASLYAKVSGYLSSISVDYGSRVTAGERIATLQLPEQQADVDRAESAYELAKVSYDRIMSVVRQTPGMLAQQDVDNARAAYDSARDQRDRAQVMLDYTSIVAPFGGIVIARNDDPGDLVQEGDTGSAAKPIVEIAQENELRLVFEAPESIVPYIEVGTPVAVRIQGTDETIAGHVARYSYDVHQATRTMHTEVDVANPDYRYKPGMYADVTITLQHVPHALAIPTQALSTDGSPNVWVVDGADRIEQRAVTTGLQTANWIQILGGLHAGERVFLGDRGSIVLGQRVTPRDATPATGN